MKITLTRLLQQFKESSDVSFLCHAIARVYVANTPQDDWRKHHVSGRDLFYELQRVAPKFFNTEISSDQPGISNLLDCWMAWPTVHAAPELSKFACQSSTPTAGAILQNRNFRMALLTAMIEQYGDHELNVYVCERDQ